MYIYRMVNGLKLGFLSGLLLWLCLLDGIAQSSPFQAFQQAVVRQDYNEAFALLYEQPTDTLINQGWLEYQPLFLLRRIEQSRVQLGDVAQRGLLRAQAILAKQDSMVWDRQAARTVLYYQTSVTDSVIPVLSRAVISLGDSCPPLFWKQLGTYLLDQRPVKKEEWDEWLDAYASVSWLLMQMTVIDQESEPAATELSLNLDGHLATWTTDCEELIKREASRTRLGFVTPQEYKRLFLQMEALSCEPSATRDSVRIRVARLTPDPYILVRVAESYLQEDQFWNAQKHLLQASKAEENVRYKAAIELRLAGLYAIRRSFRSSRLHAMQANELYPEWGRPLIFMADLIEGSGAICADSERERWAVSYLSMEYLERAIDINPALEAEVIGRINYLSESLPDEQQLRTQGLKTGDRIPVSCWLNETARVR